MIQSVSAGEIRLAHNVAQQWTSGSLFYRGAPLVADVTERGLICKRTGVGQYDFKYTNTYMSLFAGSANSQLNTTRHLGARSHGCSVAAGGKAQFYCEGVWIGEGNAGVTPGADTGPVQIGSRLASGLFALMPSNIALGYNRVLTADEFAQNHAWSESLVSPIVAQDRRYWDYGSTVPNGPEGGVVGAWDLGRPTSGQCADKSGGGVHGALTGGVAPVNTEAGRSLGFDGATGYVLLTAPITLPLTAASITFWANPSSQAGACILGNVGSSRNYFHFVGGGTNQLVVETDTASDIVKGSYSPNTGWHHYALVFDGGVFTFYEDGYDRTDVSAYLGTQIVFDRIGMRATTSSPQDRAIQNIQIFNRILSPAEIKADAMKLAQRVMWDSALEYVNPTTRPYVAGEMIPGTGYRVESGTHEVNEDPATGEHFIECVVAGVRSRLQKMSAGSHRLKLNRTTAAGDTYLNFIATKSTGWNTTGNNGYALRHRSTGDLLALVRVTNGVSVALIGSDLAATRGITYEFVITRTTTGVFTVYALGGIYTTWTAVISGTDTTYSTSEFSTATHLVGDKLFVDRQFLGEVAP